MSTFAKYTVEMSIAAPLQFLRNTPFPWGDPPSIGLTPPLASGVVLPAPSYTVTVHFAGSATMEAPCSSHATVVNSWSVTL